MILSGCLRSQIGTATGFHNFQRVAPRDVFCFQMDNESAKFPSLDTVNLLVSSYSGFPSFTIGSPALQSQQYYRLEHVVPAVLNLRVTSPSLAMSESSRRPAFITVPKGAVVETPGELHQPGLVMIKLADQPLLAFMRDLRENAEPVDRGRSFAAFGD